MNRRHLTHHLKSWLAASTLVLLAACSKAPPPSAPPKPLQVIQVGAGETASSAQRTYSGEVRPRVETTLGFQVGGKIIERRVNVGDHVSAGQVLARLDPQDTRLNLEQAEAQLNIAQAEARRYRELSQQRFVSQAALEDRENKLRAAQAQAALAKNQGAYTTLVSDKAGVIGLVLADVGQVVTPGQGVFRMAPDGDREIAVSIPEAELGAFKVGLPAQVTLYALPGKVFQASVREISPAADPATRTYPVRVQLSGIEKLPTGLSANVRFLMGPRADAASGETAIRVPLTAIFQKDKDPAVWIVTADNKVTLHAIKIARFSHDHALVTDGLAPGTTIAFAGVNSLAEGQTVRPVPAPAAIQK